MGCHVSSMHALASSANPQTCSYGVLKVVLVCEGRTFQFSEPMKVAELMLEFPNHFVAEYEMHDQKFACSGAMAAGAAAGRRIYANKRVSPLPADHDAKLFHVYLLLPMHRLNTRLSADEVALVSAMINASTTTAVPACASTGQLSSAKTSKVTPLSGRHLQEAAITTPTAINARPPTCCSSGSSNRAIAKSYSAPSLELLQDDAEASIAEDTEPHVYVDSCKDLHISRSSSWTPTLETILESYLS